MKKKGSDMIYKHDRACDLMRAYDDVLHNSRTIKSPMIYKAVAAAGASRFWVSDVRAAHVVKRLLDGRPVTLKPLKEQMFREITRRVKAILAESSERSLFDVVASVILQPAPSFYLSPQAIRDIVRRNKKWWIAEKQKRVLH